MAWLSLAVARCMGSVTPFCMLWVHCAYSPCARFWLLLQADRADVVRVLCNSSGMHQGVTAQPAAGLARCLGAAQWCWPDLTASKPHRYMAI